LKNKKKEGDEEKTLDFVQEKSDEQVSAVKEFFGQIETIQTKVPEKKVVLNYFNDSFDLRPNPLLKNSKDINQYLIAKSKEFIDVEPEDNKEQKEKDIEETIKSAFDSLKSKKR
jgi:hypothetical protein